MSLRFDDRVAVVTGAGNGIGKQYALYLASRGAKVIVNDIGTNLKGTTRSFGPANSVVEQIRSKGGIAVANYDSVQDGHKIIETAMKNFGKVDILINNAGILRDISFQNMKDEDWDVILKVHLYGTYKCCKAAWDIMKKQGYGRIINTSSASGLFGNFGQVNYSAAKLGIHGFTLALAKQGQKYNILVNTIVPKAATRMLETVQASNILSKVQPKLIAPVVVYLAHENCRQSGCIFQIGGGFVAKIRWQRSQGVLFDSQNMTPQSVRDRMADIRDFTRVNDYPTKVEDTFARVASLKPKL